MKRFLRPSMLTATFFLLIALIANMPGVGSFELSKKICVCEQLKECDCSLEKNLVPQYAFNPLFWPLIDFGQRIQLIHYSPIAISNIFLMFKSETQNKALLSLFLLIDLVYWYLIASILTYLYIKLKLKRMRRNKNK